MLASITPLGERARRASWAVTVAAFFAGAAGAGAAAGALAGALGSVALPSGVAVHVRFAALAAAALFALALDAGPLPVPGPRRQVDERWRDHYRGWVYGLGYGAQLGLGVTTIVSSAATYLTLVSAFLTGSAVRGAVVLGLYGVFRGATPLLGARVRRPAQLLALHRRLARWRAPAVRLGWLLLSAIAAISLLGSLS